MLLLLLFLSCSGTPPKPTQPPIRPTVRVVEVTFDVDQAKKDLNCVKTYLQCKEDGSSIGFEEYENQFCK